MYGVREARQVLDARVEGGEHVVGRQGRDEGEHEVVPQVDETFQRRFARTAVEVLQVGVCGGVGAGLVAAELGLDHVQELPPAQEVRLKCGLVRLDGNPPCRLAFHYFQQRISQLGIKCAQTIMFMGREVREGLVVLIHLKYPWLCLFRAV